MAYVVNQGELNMAQFAQNEMYTSRIFHIKERNIPITFK